MCLGIKSSRQSSTQPIFFLDGRRSRRQTAPPSATMVRWRRLEPMNDNAAQHDQRKPIGERSRVPKIQVRHHSGVLSSCRRSRAYGRCYPQSASEGRFAGGRGPLVVAGAQPGAMVRHERRGQESQLGPRYRDVQRGLIRLMGSPVWATRGTIAWAMAKRRKSSSGHEAGTPRRAPWTDADVFFLKDALARGMSFADVARFLVRTEDEVQEKARELSERK
jgi:hypothetical protein